MIEIIPNWHPILVHFTVGLLATSVALHFAAVLIRKETLRAQIIIVARWNLWIGTAITAITVLAGLHAFSTVPHQLESQHLAMLDHRAWALGTAALFAVLALWCGFFAHRGKFLFLALLAAAGMGLAATGYKGGELVFRHGLGVMPQPAMPEKHHHDHGGHEAHHHTEGD